MAFSCQTEGGSVHRITTMKTIALTTIAALLFGAAFAPAQETTVETSAAAPKAATEKKQKKAASQRMMALMKKGMSILKGITDKESAEAAVPKLQKLAEKTKALDKPLQEELQQAGPEGAMSFMMQLAAIAADAQEDIARLEENDFYGCEALKELQQQGEQEEHFHINLTPQKGE